MNAVALCYGGILVVVAFLGWARTADFLLVCPLLGFCAVIRLLFCVLAWVFEW